MAYPAAPCAKPKQRMFNMRQATLAPCGIWTYNWKVHKTSLHGSTFERSWRTALPFGNLKRAFVLSGAVGRAAPSTNGWTVYKLPEENREG